MKTLLKLSAAMAGTPEVDTPLPERLLSGNPQRKTWNAVDTPLPPGRLYCGVWHSEPGHWRIEMGTWEQELFTVLSGRCRVHASDGSMQEAGAGEAVFIPAGFSGSFEVLEALAKTYAIVVGEVEVSVEAEVGSVGGL